MPRLRGFAPVIDAGTETLILGSFPSAASLAAGQYYAHPRNQFWRILGALLDEPLVELPCERRLRRVLAHRIGIWDVLAACDRAGSLDGDIRNSRANELVALRTLTPRLRRIVCNGGLAARHARPLRAAGWTVVSAPSTSPAHAARTVEQKLVLWRQALSV